MIIRILACLMCAALILCPSTSVTAGELDRRNIARYTGWEPTGCYKPSQPNFYAYDIDSYNWAVSEFNAYVQELEGYLDCIRGEAADDLRTFKSILNDSIDNLESEAMADAQYARSELDLSRIMLE